VDDAELRHWQEVEHHLSELSKHPGWGALVEFSHWRMKGPKHRILNGGVDVFDKYLKETGWLRGIHDTLDAPKTVKDMVSNELERRRSLATEG
jgi:hypothetical protein